MPKHYRIIQYNKDNIEECFNLNPYKFINVNNTLLLKTSDEVVIVPVNFYIIKDTDDGEVYISKDIKLMETLRKLNNE